MDEIEELATLFKALSDPTRLRLIRLLSENAAGDCAPRTGAGSRTRAGSRASECEGRGFLCVNALAHRLGVTQSAVSQHLRVLRQAGLVSGVRHGAFVHYTLDQEGLDRSRVALQETLGVEIPVE
jgi:DNA-binding transcriptional ArsR family regulator